MTTLAIMATYEKKRLKCYGTVAAGEHVAVTVTDGAQWIGEGTALRLRVLFGPDTVGVFPFADGDAWTATGTQNADAYCELNLNTLQAEKYLKHGGTCLWILDDVENHTLYATGEFDVLPWPKRRGIDEPIDLDGYPLLLDEIKDLKEAFEEYQRTVAQMLATKQDTIFDLATIRSGAAAGATAVQPSQIARFVDDAEYKAQYGEQNKPAILFKHGTDVIVALDATPFVRDGMVADVKIVGGNLVITFNTDSGKQPITIPLTDIFNPANYYDKNAVNALLNDKQDALTFDNAPTTGSNNPVKSGGIWSALWGVLAALPTGFTSLYDWCVSQLAGKLSTSGGIVTGDIRMENGLLDAGDVQTHSSIDFLKPDQPVKSLDAPENSGNALTDADISDSLSALGSALAGKLDLAGGTMTGGIAFSAQGSVGFLGLVYDDEDHCLRIIDGWNENIAYLEVPNAADRSRVAFMNDVGNAIAAIPYSLGTTTVIDTASSETVEGETVYYGAATLANRTANIVQVTAATALDELRITFPAATSGKVRDFGLRVEVGDGSAALTAPALVPIAPTGETIRIENADGTIPELADGTATAKGVTLLYFSENAPGVFVVKGEQVQEVA